MDANDTLNELLALLWSGELDVSGSKDVLGKARLAADLTMCGQVIDMRKELKSIRVSLQALVLAIKERLPPAPPAAAGDGQVGNNGGPSNV